MGEYVRSLQAISHFRVDRFAEKVLSENHRFLREGVLLRSQLVEVQAVGICAFDAFQEVCAVLGGPVRCT